MTCTVATAGCVLEPRDLVPADGGTDAGGDASDGAMDGATDGAMDGAMSACEEPCVDPTPICDENRARPICVECIVDEIACNGVERPRCHPFTGRCVACIGDGDCLGLQVCDEMGDCVDP